jgi:hypothetical protein
MIDRDNLPEWVKGDQLAADEMNALKRLAGRDMLGPQVMADAMGVHQGQRIPFHLNRYVLLEDLANCGSASALWIRLEDDGEGVCDWKTVATVTLHDPHGVVNASGVAVGGVIPSGSWVVGAWWTDTRQHEALVFGSCECDSSSSSSSSSGDDSSSSSSSSGAEESSSSSSSGPECIDSIGGIRLADIPEGVPTLDGWVLGFDADGCLVKYPLADCAATSSSGA